MCVLYSVFDLQLKLDEIGFCPARIKMHTWTLLSSLTGRVSWNLFEAT